MTNFVMTTLISATMMVGMTQATNAQDTGGYVARTVDVDISDLDAADRADADIMHARIDRAIRGLCPHRVQGPVKKYLKARECRELAWRSVEQQLARRGGSDKVRLAIRISAPTKP